MIAACCKGLSDLLIKALNKKRTEPATEEGRVHMKRIRTAAFALATLVNWILGEMSLSVVQEEGNEAMACFITSPQDLEGAIFSVMRSEGFKQKVGKLFPTENLGLQLGSPPRAAPNPALSDDDEEHGDPPSAGHAVGSVGKTDATGEDKDLEV